MRGRPYALAFCAAVALFVSVAGQALADVVFVKTRVTMDDTGEGFKGRVIANPDRRFCERGRRVRIFREQPGGDALVGKTRTDRNGRWTFTLPEGEFGDFHARAPRKLRIISGNGIDCRRGRSKAVTIIPPEGT